MPDPFLITLSSASEMLTFFDTDIKTIANTNRKTLQTKPYTPKLKPKGRKIQPEMIYSEMANQKFTINASQ